MMFGRMSFVMIAVSLIALALPAHAIKNPVIKKVNGQYTLLLPTAMQQALTRYDRSFIPWRVKDYLPSIRKDYHFTSRQALFAVIGDFNGDRREDVVIDGHTKKADVMLCIFTLGGRKYRIVEVKRGELTNPQTQWYGSDSHREYGLFSYLIYTPPGRIKSPFEAKPLRLRTDAFQIVLYGKSAVLYYWQNGRFHRYITAD